jgi:hypothetical protein
VPIEAETFDDAVDGLRWAIEREIFYQAEGWRA